MSEDRLTRMEDKLDKLSEAVLAIARMEERMLTVFKRLENVDCAKLADLFLFLDQGVLVALAALKPRTASAEAIDLATSE